MKGTKKLQQILVAVVVVVLMLSLGSEAYAMTKPEAPKKVNVKARMDTNCGCDY